MLEETLHSSCNKLTSLMNNMMMTRIIKKTKIWSSMAEKAAATAGDDSL